MVWWLELWAELDTFFFFKKRYFSLNELQADVGYSELASHRHFLREEWSATSRKTIGGIYCQWYNFSFHGENKDFWKTWIHYHELDSLQLFKDFSDEIGGVSNECYILSWVMKCVNTQKICITLETNVFQMSTGWFYKIWNGKVSKCKINQWTDIEIRFTSQKKCPF